MARFALPLLRSTSKVIGIALVLSGAASAFAAPTFAITGNTGTMRVTDYAPLSITTSNVSDPYAVPTVGITGNTISLTFALTPSVFSATASNSTGGQTTQMDGKLDFNVSFSSPVFLQAMFSESGSDITQNTGTVSMLAGAVITETDNLAQTTDGGNFTSIFTGNSWSAGLTTDGFTQEYSNYHISLDNELIAEALANANLSTATIEKTTLTITLTPGAGTPAPEPATLALLAMPLAALALRRRKA